MNRLLPFVISITALFLGACGDDDDDAVADAGVDAALLDAGGVDVVSPEGCRGAEDCTGERLRCVGPNENECGIPPREECASDKDCGEILTHCHTIVDSCSRDGFGSECGMPCSPEPNDSCGEGFTCDVQGHCRPTLCVEDKSCPSHERCNPEGVDLGGAAHAITDGCFTIDCENDEPCPGDTVCVNKICQQGLGECAGPPPP